MKNNVNLKVGFIGIGAQKGATSWLSKCLEEHPAICFSNRKETHFFSLKFDQGFEYYKKNFNHCSQGQIKGEYSTSYLSSQKAPERIKNSFPDTKIIASLRDPVERMVSRIKHLKAENSLQEITSFSELIDRYPKLISYSRYGESLKNYFNFFDREQVLIIFYSEIKENPAEIVKIMYDFLEVDSTFTPEILKVKYASSSVKSSWIYQKINDIYSFVKSYSLGKKIISLFRKIGLNSYKIEKLIHKINPSKSVEIPIDFNEKEIFDKYFQEDIELLEELLNRDLSEWKR